MGRSHFLLDALLGAQQQPWGIRVFVGRRYPHFLRHWWMPRGWVSFDSGAAAGRSWPTICVPPDMDPAAHDADVPHMPIMASTAPCTGSGATTKRRAGALEAHGSSSLVRRFWGRPMRQIGQGACGVQAFCIPVAESSDGASIGTVLYAMALLWTGQIDTSKIAIDMDQKKFAEFSNIKQ